MAKPSQVLGFETIADLAERRANRRSLGAVEAFSVLRGSDEWRYYYTIKEAVEHSELWFIIDPEDRLVEFKIAGQPLLPFWPHEDVAELARKNMNIIGETNPMPLDHWIDSVLDETCRAESCLVALCPSNWSAELKTVDEVFADLLRYRKNPEAFWAQHFSEDRFFLTQNRKAGLRGRLP